MRYILIIILLITASVAGAVDTLGVIDSSGATLTTKNIEDTLIGVLITPTASGTIDSIWAYLDFSSNFDCRAYLYDASSNLLASTTERTGINPTNRQWIGFGFSSSQSLTASTNYIIVVWADASVGQSAYITRAFDMGYAESMKWDADDYTTGAPDPATFGNSAWTRTYIYTVLTPSAPAAATPNALHDKSANPPTGNLHSPLGGSVLHEP